MNTNNKAWIWLILNTVLWIAVALVVNNKSYQEGYSKGYSVGEVNGMMEGYKLNKTNISSQKP